ncbi:hypothetical protein ACVWV0_003122 [Ewingella americana]|jgi:hypothetical protein|uniref:hypothetical protein n=1 Tax=Ewingella TaxID=41201 RepID=UPI0012AE3EF0|nr:hypothetical protein [Ewingella americana]MRT03431.1 hypothetical protein [Ewingella americana]NWA39185.1 hypothetical protein [Pseudomonas reactans]
MRTLLFLLSGYLLLALFYLVVKLFSRRTPALNGWGLWTFIVVWLGVALANMLGGVLQAGYGVGEELPIMLLIFLPPAALAFYLWRRSLE